MLDKKNSSFTFNLNACVIPVQGILTSTVEAGCLVTFTSRVMLKLPVYVFMPASYGVLAVACVKEAVKSIKVGCLLCTILHVRFGNSNSIMNRYF